MIELEDVTKSFPGMEKPAVDGVTLSIAKGETLVLLGSSGCGKSTTLKLINRLVEPDGGMIRIDGVSVQERPILDLRRSMGYVIQDTGLFPHWTVAENVGCPLRIRGIPQSERRKKSFEMLDRVGLPPETFGKRYPHELSGGQQQRVGVARALSGDPDILLMDEPFGALDGVTREALQQEMERLRQELSITILFVTHDLFEALSLGDRVGVMHEGTLQQVGTKAEVLNRPATAFVKTLFEKPAKQLRVFQESKEGSPAV